MSGDVLVIGGRSKIGSALIGELAGHGEPVRALVRAVESANPFPDGVQAVTAGDLADRDSLRLALDGADRLFLLCGPTEDEVQLNRNAIDVARSRPACGCSSEARFSAPIQPRTRPLSATAVRGRIQRSPSAGNPDPPGRRASGRPPLWREPGTAPSH